MGQTRRPPWWRRSPPRARRSVDQDAYLLGLIQDNDGDISVLQSSVAANTADLGDLLSVITVGATGITVNDLTVTGDLDITGVFSAATGLFNYLSANNADFEDMIAEAAQVEQMTFFEGRALGSESSLDIDGTLNVDGNSTMGGDLTVDGIIYNQGAPIATVPYVDAGDAALQADIDQNEADSDAAEASLSTRVAAEESARATADASVITLLKGDVGANYDTLGKLEDMIQVVFHSKTLANQFPPTKAGTRILALKWLLLSLDLSLRKYRTTAKSSQLLTQLHINVHCFQNYQQQQTCYT